MRDLDSFKSRLWTTVQRAQNWFSGLSWVVILIAILLFALVLRLILFTGILDSDAIEYAYYAYGASHGSFQFTLVPRDIQFRLALYLPLALLYTLFGVSENVLVIYVLFISLCGVALIYGIGRLQAGESAGVIAALVWAALPLNVFLSTKFGPDEILATLTIATVFFLLWGNKLGGRKALFRYVIGILIALLAVLVKPSAVLIFVFVVLFFAYKAIRHWKERIATWIRKLNPSKLKTTAFIFGALFLAIGYAYFQIQQKPFLLSLFRASKDLADLFVRGSTQEDVQGLWVLQTPLFLVGAPIFIVVAVASMVRRLHAAMLPLLWAAAVFLYFEWGSMSPNPVLYSPFLKVVNDRNTLFIFAPFVVIAGIFLSQGLKKTTARWLAVLSLLLVLPLAWWQKGTQFSGIPGGIITIAAVAAIIGALWIPFILDKQRGISRTAFLVGLVLVLLAGFLYPTPPNHISAEFWQSRASYRRVIREVANFFMDHPDYPIFALSGGNARELNFLSNFKLGFSVYGVTQPGARIHVIRDDPKAFSDSGYIYLRDEINQIRPVPADWWKVAEFDAGSGKPVLIYRHLSVEDAAVELASAKASVAQDANEVNLERLLAAAVNAGDAQVLATAWISLDHLVPGKYPLGLLTPTFIDAFQKSELPLSGNLLASELVGGLDTYRADPNLQISLINETSGPEQTLDIQVTSNLRGSALYKQLLLEPDSIYIFSIEVKSTVGVDLLRVMNGKISDSHDYSEVYGEWEKQVVIFITPALEQDTMVRLDLLTVAKAGVVQIKNPRLYMVKFAQP